MIWYDADNSALPLKRKKKKSGNILFHPTKTSLYFYIVYNIKRKLSISRYLRRIFNGRHVPLVHIYVYVSSCLIEGKKKKKKIQWLWICCRYRGGEGRNAPGGTWEYPYTLRAASCALLPTYSVSPPQSQLYIHTIYTTQFEISLVENIIVTFPSIIYYIRLWQERYTRYILLKKN